MEEETKLATRMSARKIIACFLLFLDNGQIFRFLWLQGVRYNENWFKYSSVIYEVNKIP